MAGVAGGRAIGKFGEITGIFILARHMEEASQTQKLKKKKHRIVLAKLRNLAVCTGRIAIRNAEVRGVKGGFPPLQLECVT